MIEDNAGDWVYINQMLQPAEALEGVSLEEKKAAYEVIRMIDGTPLYFEDHCKRMEGSLKALGQALNISARDLKEQICELVITNRLSNGNVKVVVYMEEEIPNTLCHISKSYYPPMEEVLRGVPVSLLQLERSNPNVKQLNHTYKEKANQKIKETNVFEVLLVNQDGKLSEGSRSNLFFIHGNKVFTAPGEYVLKGITREYIMDTCKELGLEVVETLVDVKDLEKMDGLFISGTSIKVLPVSAIDGQPYASASNSVIIAIRERFDQVIGEYILKHKR